MSGKTSPQRQYAALPYRWSAAGSVEVMLITSRGTKRWVIPKGWPVPGLTPHDAAAREAMEEGGLIGTISERPIGYYNYDKELADGSLVRCAVETFPFEVERQLPSWPEQSQRRTRWFAHQDAAEAVQERALMSIIRKLPLILR